MQVGKIEPSTFSEDKQQFEPAKPSLGRRLSRKVVPGLPRPATFRRQNSELRKNLQPVDPTCNERRPVSNGRRRALSARPVSPAPVLSRKQSAPTVCTVENNDCSLQPHDTSHNITSQTSGRPQIPAPPPSPPPDIPPNVTLETSPDIPPAMSEVSFNDDMDEQIRIELEEKWILNLSMHFRDKSPREKFFVTYAETPTKWRRVTISCDYRDAPPDSLERDLQSLQYQRDKSSRIYEAIRMSLPDIQFYDSVTNLKLETSRDDRLHVHVTEDTNEIIPYPSTNAVQHLDYTRVPESEVMFDSHMSGFVYKVRVHGHTCIKKEIPGPDSVEEFLYEINALYVLKGSRNVIQFQGLVIDEQNNLVKGLLISYAEQGPLVDMIFDYKGSIEWERRERWAKHIVRGLSEIHEAGFVQGDFTLSNIVIDEYDRAQIIDINRRGCPVGWEPPEIARLIESGQRISMYIGVKSDLFQLGMVLWALAEEEDEPERQPRDLCLQNSRKEIPQYYRDLTDCCLSRHPRDRIAARNLLAFFPALGTDNSLPPPSCLQLPPLRHEYTLPIEIEHIDSSQAVERDLDRNRSSQVRPVSPGPHRYIDRRGSIDIPFDGPGSYIVSRRGREIGSNTTPQGYSSSNHYRNSSSRSPSNTDDPQIIPVSPGGEHRWEEIEVGGRGYLIQRDSIDIEETGLIRERRGRSILRLGGGRDLVRVEHTDSGLADMEYPATADMDLAGVGGHESLTLNEGQVPAHGEMDLEDYTEKPQQIEESGQTKVDDQQP